MIDVIINISAIHNPVLNWLCCRRFKIGHPTFYEFLKPPSENFPFRYLVKNSCSFKSKTLSYGNSFRVLNPSCPLVDRDQFNFNHHLFVRVYFSSVKTTLFFANEELIQEIGRYSHNEFRDIYEEKGFEGFGCSDRFDFDAMFEEFLSHQKGIYFNHFKKLKK